MKEITRHIICAQNQYTKSFLQNYACSKPKVLLITSFKQLIRTNISFCVLLLISYDPNYLNYIRCNKKSQDCETAVCCALRLRGNLTCCLFVTQCLSVFNSCQTSSDTCCSDPNQPSYQQSTFLLNTNSSSFIFRLVYFNIVVNMKLKNFDLNAMMEVRKNY